MSNINVYKGSTNAVVVDVGGQDARTGSAQDTSTLEVRHLDALQGHRSCSQAEPADVLAALAQVVRPGVAEVSADDRLSPQRGDGGLGPERARQAHGLPCPRLDQTGLEIGRGSDRHVAGRGGGLR
jgi:hypothetical protein